MWGGGAAAMASLGKAVLRLGYWGATLKSMSPLPTLSITASITQAMAVPSPSRQGLQTTTHGSVFAITEWGWTPRCAKAYSYDSTGVVRHAKECAAADRGWVWRLQIGRAHV